MAKYIQLAHLESCWQREYLLKKDQEGAWITKHLDRDLHRQAIRWLETASYTLEELERWKGENLVPLWLSRCNQALRARRKRYFNAEALVTSKKSIDLTYEVWLKLSLYAQRAHLTLSEAIHELLQNKEGTGSPETPAR